jgi:hypothetical protein
MGTRFESAVERISGASLIATMSDSMGCALEKRLASRGSQTWYAAANEIATKLSLSTFSLPTPLLVS